MINDSLLRYIKTLPPLPESVVKIQDICANPNSSVSDIAKVIEGDPMLTANLLKAANSPLYGFSREIKTLSQAVALFGMATVRGFALAGAVRSTLAINMSPYNMENEQFVGISQLQNALMLRWYSHVNRSLMDILSPAAFLATFGRVVIAQELIKENKSEEFAKIIAKKGLETAEIEFIGGTYQEVSATIFKYWHFEQELIDAIAFSADPEKADPTLREYAYALRVVQLAVTTPFGITKESAEAAGKVVAFSGQKEEIFVKAVSAFLKRVEVGAEAPANTAAK